MKAKNPNQHKGTLPQGKTFFNTIYVQRMHNYSIDVHTDGVNIVLSYAGIIRRVFNT